MNHLHGQKWKFLATIFNDKRTFAYNLLDKILILIFMYNFLKYKYI